MEGKMGSGWEGIDEFDQKAAKKLAEELSEIQMSRELMYKTLLAAQKNEPPVKRKNSRKRWYFLGACVSAASLLLCLRIGMTGSADYNAKRGYPEYILNSNELLQSENSSQSAEQNAGMSNPDSFPDGYSGINNSDSYNGNSSYNSDKMDHYSNSNEAIMQEPAVSEFENNQEDLLEWDNFPNANPEEESIQKERMLLEELAELLTQDSETENVTEIDGFTKAETDCEYLEFHYWKNEIEIICRVYADGNLEAMLSQEPPLFKFISGWQGTELLWKILENRESN